MKVSYSPYQLIPKSSIGSVSSGKPREGCLLRVAFTETQIGYADCHSWPELGDCHLSGQLRSLQTGRLEPLIHRSLDYALIDAEARSAHVSLWEKAAIPASHILLTDYSRLSVELLQHWSAQSVSRVKIKLGRNPVDEAKTLRSFADDFLKTKIKFRLDFNSCLSTLEFERFLESLGPSLESLDLIEDPTPYHPELWFQLQKRWNIRLALDRFSLENWQSLKEGSFSVLVLKPAIQDPELAYRLALDWNLSLLVTSYLDHPFGQLCAAWTASELARKHSVHLEICGLLSHSAYEENSFSKLLGCQGSQLIPPQGVGFGMTQELEALKWIGV